MRFNDKTILLKTNVIANTIKKKVKLYFINYKQWYQGKCNIWDKRMTEITIFFHTMCQLFPHSPFTM